MEMHSATLESDKAAMDLPSRAIGWVEKVHTTKGGKVNTGDLLATLKADGAQTDSAPAPAPAAASVAAAAPAPPAPPAPGAAPPPRRAPAACGGAAGRSARRQADSEVVAGCSYLVSQRSRAHRRAGLLARPRGTLGAQVRARARRGSCPGHGPRLQGPHHPR